MHANQATEDAVKQFVHTVPSNQVLVCHSRSEIAQTVAPFGTAPAPNSL
jgi:hypothetical protein